MPNPALKSLPTAIRAARYETPAECKLRRHETRLQQLDAYALRLKQEQQQPAHRDTDVRPVAPVSPGKRVCLVSQPRQIHPALPSDQYRPEGLIDTVRRRGRASITPWIAGGVAIAAGAGTGAHLWLLPGALMPRALVGLACLFSDGYRRETQKTNTQAPNYRYEPNDAPVWRNLLLHWSASYAMQGIALGAFSPALMGAAISTLLLKRVVLGVAFGLSPTAMTELLPARCAPAADFMVRQARKAHEKLPLLVCGALIGAGLFLPAYPLIAATAAATLHVRQTARLATQTAFASNKRHGAAARRATELAPRVLLRTALPLSWSFAAASAG